MMNTELNEPILDNNYPIYYSYFYLMDGEPRRNMNLMGGTVHDLKREYKLKEVRRCDAVVRELM